MVRFAGVKDTTPLGAEKMPDEFDMMDGVAIEHITENYYDHEDDDCEDGWDDEDADED